MQLWVDIYDAYNNRLGDGPIFPLSATVKRTLDGAGSLDVEIVASDRRALDLLRNERRFRVWVADDKGKRELGRGSVQDIEFQDAESGPSLKIGGPDSMDDLRKKSVLLNRTYDETLISDVAADLISLVPGWSVSVASDLGAWSARLDGGNVLKALIKMIEQKGLHFRESPTPFVLEIGPFGDVSTLSAIGISEGTREIGHNDHVILIYELGVKNSTSDVYNWVIPLGAGEGSDALTLADSNRPGIFTVTGPDGATLYGVKHEQSIAEFGDEIQRVNKYDDITPINETAEAAVNAANALYDATVADLERHALRQDTYSFSARKPRKALRPGEKIRLTYKGLAFRDGMPVTYVNVNDLFWVVSVEERISNSGELTMGVEVSTVAKHERDMQRDLLGLKEAVEVLQFSVSPPT